MLSIKFTRPEDFIEELEADRRHVERKIVRAARLWRGRGPATVIVRAAAVVVLPKGRHLIRLEVYCGEDMPGGGPLPLVQERADQAEALVKEAVTKLGLVLRSGVIEEG